MQRDSQEYQHRKMAWELTQSKQWRELLEPLLKRTADDSKRKNIGGLNEAFEVAGHHAEIAYARHILNYVERKANQFINTKVSADPEA